MRHSIKRISKSALSVILALMMVVSTMVVGIVSTSALSCSGGYVYFDNSIAQWDNVYFVIGKDAQNPKDNYSSVYSMSKISGTNLYYKALPSWDGATYFSFICTPSAWGDGTWGSSNLSNATYYTTADTSWKRFDSGNTYVAAPSVKQTKNCNANTAYESDGYSALNFTQTLKAKVSTDGGNTYSEASDAFVNLSISTNKLSDNGTSTTSSIDSKAASVTATAARSATVNLSYSNPDSDYTFAGWGDSSSTSPSSTSATTSYTASAADTTYYAYFKYDSKKDLAKPNVTLTSNGVSSSTKGTITSEKSITLNISSSGADYPVNDKTLKFELINSSDVVVKTLALGNNELSFADDNITDGTYTVKVSADEATYKPAFSSEFTLKKVQLYTATLAMNEYAEVTAKYTDAYDVADKTITEENKADVPSGNTVTVTVTAQTGYVCTQLDVKTDSGVSVDVTNNDDGTYSFKMPGENVTVTPTITEKSKATVSVSSNDDAKGTAELSTTGTIYVGDSFTVKATPLNDFVFESFSVTGADQIATVKNDDGTTTGTFKATSQNVSVTANFTENKGVQCEDKFLVYGNDNNNPNNWGIIDGQHYIDVYYKDKAYYATIPRKVFAAKGNFYFALCGSQTEISDLWWTQGSAGTTDKAIKVTVNDTEDKIRAQRSDYGNYQNNKNAQFVEITKCDSSVIAINVKIEISSVGDATDNQGAYTITPVLETVPEGTATVYAKDGTTVSGGTNQLGETKVTEGYYRVKSDVESETYRTYTALKDSYLTIQTTMDSSAVTNGYYVYAFCINGESYPAVAKKGGVYETTYKVTGKEEDNIVEITPVYYNTNVENAGDYISVYVDASQLKGKWGNTISCYSYYYTGNVTEGKPDAHETTKYPGQPMLMGSNGLYYTRVPRYAYSNGKKIEKSTGVYYPISGVTLNSFSEHDLHGTLYSNLNGNNYQTYDYDDFKYIADLGFDTVKFVIEYREGTTNQKTLLKDSNDHPTLNPTDTIDVSVYAGQNGWNDLYDFDGNKTDILGKVLTPEQQKSSPIYVVSTGNQNTSMGKWSTVWYVFDQSGKYVTQGIPSDFITRNADGGTTKPESSAYQAIDKAGLKGVPVRICYESEQTASTSTDTGNSGVRVDGRWYYTTSTQDAPVDVIVQYRDNTSQDVWTTDTTGVSGTATIDGVTKKIFTERNVTAQLNAVAKSGYVFVEWGTVDDNGEHYTKLSNIKSASAEFMIDTSYHLVARFEKVQNGSLVISHEKYTGPNFVGGGGYYLVSAVVYNADGSVNSTYDLTEGSITIPDLASLKDNNCTIKIKMVTKMKGDNKFIDWYMLTPEGDYDNITQEEAVWGATGEVSQEVTVDVNQLYSGSELVVNTFQYYSDIAKVTKDAVLNYKYYNRFGEEKTYIVTVKLDDEYIQKNGYEITDKLIYDNAPAIEDLYKDCIWTITAQSTTRNSTTATIWGTHNKVTYNVTLDDGINEKVAAKVEYSKYLTNPNTDAFYTAPAEKNSVSFAYWLVEENGKEVARCYANEFNLKILGNYTITAVYADEKNSSLSIVGPTYTREQFTDDAGNVKSDYLYVDFIVAYMNSYGILLNGDLAKDMNYHTGLIIEFDRNIKVTDEDLDNAKLSKPLTQYAYDDYSGIEDIAKNSEKTSGSLTVVNDTRAIYKFEIDNAGYNNKNRLDYYVKFNNTKSFRHYVMKAYYYVYYTDKNGKTVYQQTEPVYFCLFEIGNSTADLSKH